MIHPRKQELTFLSGVGAVLILASAIHSQTNSNDEATMKSTGNATDPIASMLTEFEKTKELPLIENAIREMNHLKQPVAATATERFRHRKDRMQMWLKLAVVIEKNLDPTFGRKDMPMENVPTPIGVPGVAGMDPKFIKDPALRAEYETALKKNEEKAKKSLFQGRLRRLQGHVALYIGHYAANNYRSYGEDRKEVEDLLKASGLSETQRQGVHAQIIEWQGRVNKEWD